MLILVSLTCKSYMNKVSLQTNLERNSSNFAYISLWDVNFENLTVEFHVPYVLNMRIKFCSNWILLLFDQLTYFLYTILNYKNLKL